MTLKISCEATISRRPGSESGSLPSYDVLSLTLAKQSLIVKFNLSWPMSLKSSVKRKNRSSRAGKAAQLISFSTVTYTPSLVHNLQLLIQLLPPLFWPVMYYVLQIAQKGQSPTSSRYILPERLDEIATAENSQEMRTHASCCRSFPCYQTVNTNASLQSLPFTCELTWNLCPWIWPK